MIDSGAQGCGPVSCVGWATLYSLWTVLGAEGVSQAYDKGWSNLGAGDKADAALELAAVLPPVKIVKEASVVAKAFEPSAKTVEKVARQLKNDGLKSLLKSQQKLERRLAEHTEKLQSIKEAGGYTSSVEREIAGFKKELNAIKSTLEKACAPPVGSHIKSC